MKTVKKNRNPQTPQTGIDFRFAKILTTLRRQADLVLDFYNRFTNIIPNLILKNPFVESIAPNQ